MLPLSLIERSDSHAILSQPLLSSKSVLALINDVTMIDQSEFWALQMEEVELATRNAMLPLA